MRIQHNIAALNSHRQLTANNNAVGKNLERLSSGYRINRAGDDAAGLAISEKMRAQITGLETAQKNANDGISLVQTAEGALTEVHSMLNRMVELADQSANGTYQDEVDRENLQKEIESLKSEIDRISQSTNFNGIDLLNGKVNEALSVEFGNARATTTAAETTGEVGTFGTDVDGVLVGATQEVSYEQKLYIGELTNSDTTADKDISFTYKDNNGGNQTIKLTIAKGATATIEDIKNALNGTTGTAVKTINDSGNSNAFADGTKTGKFTDLYEVNSNGNVLTITAKKSEKVGTGETIKGGNLGGITLEAVGTNTTISQTDLDAANTSLKEDYADAGLGGNDIDYGAAAGAATKHQAASAGSYQVASTVLTVTATGADAHNKSVKVGDVNYVFQKGDEELKGVPTGAEIIKLTGNETATDIAGMLAAAITAKEGTNGNYVASATGDAVTISESTNYAQAVIDGDKEPGIGKEVAVNNEFTTSAETLTSTGTMVTLDASRISNGTTISVDGHDYTFVANANEKVASGAKALVFNEQSTSEDLAQMLADAMTADGITNVTANGASVDLAASNIDVSGMSAKSAGLTLQIGDTSDTFNKLSVQIESTSAASLGIDKVDISTQKGASDAVQVIKNAINQISSTRGDLGAIQNRLEHTINNLAVTSENMTAAESRIRDVDMAKEMMAYTKNNILVQASQAMLAQANQQPQGVLQLLQ